MSRQNNTSEVRLLERRKDIHYLIHKPATLQTNRVKKLRKTIKYLQKYQEFYITQQLLTYQMLNAQNMSCNQLSIIVFLCQYLNASSQYL